MRALEWVKEFTLSRTINTIVNLAARGARTDADATLLRMFRLGKKLTRDPLWLAVIEDFERKVLTKHPAMGVARRFLTQLSPRMRASLIRTLFVKETLLGPAKRHALESVLGYYPPTAMVISPTMNCPLRCYGCYAGSYDKTEELSFEEVDSIIEQGKEIGLYLVVISGGEPFSWKPLMRIFEKHSDCIFQVYTSGLLLDDETVDRLTDMSYVSPAISCEGFEEETDRRRGKGAFARVCRAMLRLKERGVLVTFSATATSENLDVITSDAFVDHWIEMGAMLGWYFSYMPIGRAPKLELMPTPVQRVELSRRVKRLRAEKPIVLIDFWNDGEYSGGCIAGARKYFHINNNGDVEPCVFCHFAKENIRERPLKEILGSDFFRAFRARQPFNPDLRRPCIMIDNPHVLREIVAETGAHGTHEGAESLIHEFAAPLDRYAAELGEALKNGPVVNIEHRA
jgi:MoaA/NifB/PqqE/SkfB family radical SAM enzyme